MARHNDVGSDGEDVACEYLEGKGWQIIERNFRRPYGEIDIVARETGGGLVFVEVKSVSYGTKFRPEENMHPQKLRRLGNTIMTYLASKGQKGDWRLDLLVVRLDPSSGRAEVKHLVNIVIGT
ncbi:MAG: YraN family protein [Patescibacteria group bacterium]